MAENYISEGGLVTLENATAASNIAAGRMVCTPSGINSVYSLDRETAAMSSTAGTLGTRFIGVLDDDVSAGQCPITVWTEGVFEFQLDSGITTAALIGRPVYPSATGGGARVTTLAAGCTGCYPIGSVVGLIDGTSGQYVRVKIAPGAFRWGPYSSVTGTEQGNNFPVTL